MKEDSKISKRKTDKMPRLKLLKMDEEERRNMIVNGNMWRTLWLLALPTLMMSVVQSLMPLSDGLFINNVAGTFVASAVTFSEPVIMVVLALAQGLSVAAMAVIGQTFGSGNFERVKHIAVQTVVIGFLAGICIAPILALISIPISGHVTPEISENVRLYISLYAIVLPFSFMESIYNGIMNSTGRPEAPLIRMVIMLILKIIGNCIFVYWLDLEVVGCVLASLMANVIVCIWMFHELFIQKGRMQLTLKGFQFDIAVIKKLVKIGIPSMLTQMMLSLGFVLINNETQKYGAIVLNGQGIANNISSVCFNLPAAFGSAVTTMVSMNIGAGLPERAKKSAYRGCISSAITAVFIISIIVPASSHLTILFTRVPEVLEVANHALHIYTYSVVGFGICIAVQGAMIGLGRTKIPLILGVLRIWLFRYIFILLTESFLREYSVFWGNLFSNYMAAIISLIILFSIRWKSVLEKV